MFYLRFIHILLNIGNGSPNPFSLRAAGWRVNLAGKGDHVVVFGAYWNHCNLISHNLAAFDLATASATIPDPAEPYSVRFVAKHKLPNYHWHRPHALP